MQALALHAVTSVLHTSTDPATSIVAIDPQTGAVKAMVDYLPNGRTMQFNLATQAHRSTGSSFKPITLATALSEGVSLYSTFYGPPELFITDPACATNNGSWDVHNFADEAAGTMNLLERDRELGQHDLRPAHREGRGAERRADGALHGDHEPSGPEPYFKPVCAITLGSVGFTPLELTDVYATIAIGGIHHDPQAFETRSRANWEGDRRAHQGERVVSSRERRRRAHVCARRA